MVRHATTDDIPRMIELGRAMHAESPTFSRLAFDAERLAATIANAIASPAGFARVAERGGLVVGGMLAMAAPHFFSADLVGCDLALFIAPEYRGGMAAAGLVCAYKAWALEVGVVLPLLGVMAGIDPDKAEAFLRRMGGRRAGVVMEF